MEAGSAKPRRGRGQPKRLPAQFVGRDQQHLQIGHKNLKLSLAARGDVPWWKGGALAEEEILHVLGQDLLVVPIGGVYSVLVQDHLSMFAPHLSSFLREFFINPFAHVLLERRRELFSQLPLH